MPPPDLPSGLTIEVATPSDIPGVKALAGQIWRTSYPGIISSAQIEYMLELMYSTSRLQRDIQEGTVYLKALWQGEWIGFAAFSMGANHESPAWLHKLYLQPQFQGLGIGQLLIQEVITLVAGAGGKFLRLRVNRHNERAVRAYRKAGFEIQEDICSDIGGGYFMDDHLMEVKLLVGSA